VRQVSVIESLELELKKASSERAVSTPKSPKVISPEGKIRRRRVRNDLYSEHMGRCDSSSVFDYHVVNRRRSSAGRVA
jgi:hypothetical protein